jgi:hypothetical protein
MGICQTDCSNARGEADALVRGVVHRVVALEELLADDEVDAGAAAGADLEWSKSVSTSQQHTEAGSAHPRPLVAAGKTESCSLRGRDDVLGRREGERLAADGEADSACWRGRVAEEALGRVGHAARRRGELAVRRRRDVNERGACVSRR